MKDNRAFCKYICPITCFLKIGSKFSLLKINRDEAKCMDCKACDKSCPMDIKVSEYIQKGLRITSSECIICLNCVKVCPNDVLTTSNSIDKKFPEFINYAQ